MVRDNTKEKTRPSICNNDKKKKKKISEPDEFDCNEELEQTQPIKSCRQPIVVQPATVVRSKFELSTPVVGMFKNLKEQYPTRNFDAEIKEFESQERMYIIQEQSESVTYLGGRETFYYIDPYEIKKKQSNLKWLMRAILMGWMMEIHMTYSLKREVHQSNI
jgi:hypothetical protein